LKVPTSIDRAWWDLVFTYGEPGQPPFVLHLLVPREIQHWIRPVILENEFLFGKFQPQNSGLTLHVINSLIIPADIFFLIHTNKLLCHVNQIYYCQLRNVIDLLTAQLCWLLRLYFVSVHDTALGVQLIRLAWDDTPKFFKVHMPDWNFCKVWIVICASYSK